MTPAIFFYAFSALAIAFSLMVILLKNPIASGLSLVASFFCVSAIFVLSNATFLGVIQILIYAGAILVLFLYVLMLLNLQDESWVFKSSWNRTQALYAALVVISLGAVLYYGVSVPTRELAPLPEGFGSIRSVGVALIGKAALPFEWVSVVLLAGIFGVIALTPRKEEDA